MSPFKTQPKSYIVEKYHMYIENTSTLYTISSYLAIFFFSLLFRFVTTLANRNTCIISSRYVSQDSTVIHISPRVSSSSMDARANASELLFRKNKLKRIYRESWRAPTKASSIDRASNRRVNTPLFFLSYSFSPFRIHHFTFTSKDPNAITRR